MQIHISVSEYQIQNEKFKAQWKSSEENACEDHRSCIKLDWPNIEDNGDISRHL